MCDKCFDLVSQVRAEQGVGALEALANGEQVPEPEFEAIPLLAMEMGDKVGLITSREGWEAIKKMMAVFGNVHELDD